jgi:signal peptidase I
MEVTPREHDGAALEARRKRKPAAALRPELEDDVRSLLAQGERPEEVARHLRAHGYRPREARRLAEQLDEQHQDELRSRFEQRRRQGAPIAPLAVLVTCLLGPGAGHALAGLPRRAAGIWLSFAVLGVGYLAAVAAAPSSIPWLGIAGLGVAAYAMSIVDLVVVSRARLQRASGAGLVVFALASLALTVTLAQGVRSSLLAAFKVPSGSMMPTLLVGDYFFVSKLAPIERGAAVVYQSPENRQQTFVHRVVGVGGDHIETRGAKLLVNGVELPQCSVGSWTAPAGRGLELVVEFGPAPYLIALAANAEEALGASGSWDVPEGNVFVVGDNRDNSHDSRRWQGGRGGTVPVAHVEGRAATVFLRDDRVAQRSLYGVALPAGAEHLQARLDECLAAGAGGRR